MLSTSLDDINVDDINDESINNLLRSNTKQRLVSLLSKASESAGGNFTCGGQIGGDYKSPGIEVLCDLNSSPSPSSSVNTTTIVSSPSKNLNTKIYKPIRSPIITKNQASEIIQYFEKAPFGKGDKTIYDEQVRKTWQLDPSQFRITNQQWKYYIDNLVEKQVKPGLGIHPSIIVKSTLYKLLLYEEGGHFDYHRDTEKEDKMFATLVVQLPSLYSGGEIIVQHANSEETYEFAKEGSSKPLYFSFYCDCNHKVSKLTSGYRLCLVYNVCYASGIKPTIVDRSSHFENLNSIVENWNDDTPYLCYLLEHKYSEEGLKYDCLKGRDSNLMQILQQYNSKYSSIGIKLGMMSKKQSGGSGNDKFWSEAEFAINHVVDEQGNKVIQRRFKISKSIIIPENILENLTVSKSEYEGHTGNAGASATRWYSAACILICPNRFKHVLALEVGEDEALKELENMWIRYEQDPSLLETITNFIEKFMRVKHFKRTKVTKYVVKLKNDHLASQLLRVSSSGNNLDSESLVALVREFGLETLRKKVTELLLKSRKIDLAYGFLLEIEDDKIADMVIDCYSNITTGSTYETTILLCEKYNKKLSNDVRQKMLSNWVGSVTDLFEMAKRLEDGYCFRAVLNKYFGPKTTTLPHRFVKDFNDFVLNVGTVVECIEHLGLNKCSKFLKELLPEYCENVYEVELIRVIKMFISHTTNDHIVIFMIEQLCSGLSQKVTTERVDQLAEILLELEKKGEEFVIAFVKGIEPSKEDQKNYHLIIFPIIAKLKASLSTIINSGPIQKLISKCMAYYDKVIEKPTLTPPPANWTIDVTLNCTCEYCQMATQFLKNPHITEYKLQQNEKVRKHVTDNIVAVTKLCLYDTIKIDRPPYILKINKNTQSKAMQAKAGEEVKANKIELASLISSNLEPNLKKLKTEE